MQTSMSIGAQNENFPLYGDATSNPVICNRVWEPDSPKPIQSSKNEFYPSNWSKSEDFFH